MSKSSTEHDASEQEPIANTVAHSLARTRAWIAGFIIAHEICPFARRDWEAGHTGLYPSEADNEEQAFQDLLRTLERFLDSGEERETTAFLIYPGAFADFDAFNDFLGVCDGVIDETGLSGSVQIVGFHPHYRFADSLPDDPADYTNRSPYPMLHLLRESLLERAVDGWRASGRDPEDIPRRNIEHLRAMGLAAVRQAAGF
ncbi:MAG: DUF1415 family protein [Gammaproteobacteria bacterium]